MYLCAFFFIFWFWWWVLPFILDKRFGILTCLKYFKHVDIPKRFPKINLLSFGEMGVMQLATFSKNMLHYLYDCAKTTHEYDDYFVSYECAAFYFTVRLNVSVFHGLYLTLFVSQVKRCIHLLSFMHDVEKEKSLHRLVFFSCFKSKTA